MIAEIIKKNSFTQGLILLAVVFLAVDVIVKSWKGHNSIFQDLLFRFEDMFKYFIDETTGDIVQKMNATIGFILFSTSIGAIAIIFFKFLKNDTICYELLPWFICPLIALPIALIFCEKHTRHRY